MESVELKQAAGGISGGGRVMQGCCSFYCNAGIGRCGGLHLD